MQTLTEMYRECAEHCFYAGIPCDDSPNGAIHRWVIANVKHRPETAFYIVLGICCELAELEAAESYNGPKYCKGQKRLFETEKQYISHGNHFIPNPKYGRYHD